MYQICISCVMDTSDPKINFTTDGVCDHCLNFQTHVKPNWNTGEIGKQELNNIIQEIKTSSKGHDFDCLIGMSGGADSSFMLHQVVKEFGLRPLVFHVDGGWNSELASNNIEVLVDKLGLDLYTEVINWEEMKNFQLAMFKSGIPSIDIPQDHAFIATLYKFAEKYNIKYILNGGNFSTECVRNPLDYFYYGTDMSLIKDILKQYGTIQMKTYPFSSVLYHKFYLHYIKRIKVIKPLNYIPYIKKDAMEFLKNTYGWQPYPQKHFESRFTKFFEGYWLPNKFGFDTRRVQYSSLILTGQMSRSNAIELLQNPSLQAHEIKNESEYIANKLDITLSELDSYYNAPNKTHRNYKNQEWMFNFGAKTMQLIGREKSIKR